MVPKENQTIPDQFVLFKRVDRFLFDLEFIKKASKSKLKITTISVELRPNVVFSKVGLKILFKEFGNFLKILIKS